jgi:hypothetical protein
MRRKASSVLRGHLHQNGTGLSSISARRSRLTESLFKQRWRYVTLLRSMASLANRLSGQTSSGSPPLPASSPSYVDDNPRSPKRRRISTDQGGQDIKTDTEASGSKLPPGLAAQSPSKDAQAKNFQTKPLVDDPSQHALKVSVDGYQPAGQAQNATAKLPQSSPLDRLPLLDLQASQILTFLSRLTPAEAMGLSNTPNAPTSREYASLRAVFDRTRRLISPGWPFLPQHDLGLRDNTQIEIVRKANQAIFMSSIFTGEIGLRDMDRSFLAVFVPETGELSKAQGAMYLDLKTQGFITAWRTGAAPPDLVMRDMFGPDLDKALLARRPGTTSLTPTEQEFLRQVNSRRGILESAVNTKTLEQLPVTYKWEDFSREVSSYLISHIEQSSRTVEGVLGEDRDSPGGGVARSQMPGHLSAHGSQPPTSSTNSGAGEPPVKEDFVALAAKAADIALRSVLGLSFTDKIPDMPSPGPPTLASTSPAQLDNSTPNPAAPASSLSEPKKEIATTPTPGDKAQTSAANNSYPDHKDAVGKDETTVSEEKKEKKVADDTPQGGEAGESVVK